MSSRTIATTRARTAFRTVPPPIDYPGVWGLISYWKLDEASGQRDDSRSTSHLTDTNTVTQATGATAVLGSSAQFVAANSEQLTRVDNAALSSGDVDLWVAAWAYLDSKPSNGGIAFKGTGVAAGTVEYALFYQGGGTDRLRFQIGDSAAGSLTTVSATVLGSPSLATWYFVLGYHDSVNDEIGISVNGGAFTTGATSGRAPADTAGSFRIGSLNGASFFDGRIDSVAIGKSPPGGIAALATQIRDRLYNAGLGREYPWT